MNDAEKVAAELQKVRDFVKSVCDQMELVQLQEERHNPVVFKLLQDTLTPMLTGIFLAHGIKANTLDIEDTLMNIFCIGMLDYYKRRYDVKGGRDPVMENAQQIVNTIATTLSVGIADHFKPVMQIPVSRKHH